MGTLISSGINKHIVQLHDSKPFVFLKTFLNYSLHLTCRCTTALYKYLTLKQGSKRNATRSAPVLCTRWAICTALPQTALSGFLFITLADKLVYYCMYKLDPTMWKMNLSHSQHLFSLVGLLWIHFYGFCLKSWLMSSLLQVQQISFLYNIRLERNIPTDKHTMETCSGVVLNAWI